MRADWWLVGRNLDKGNAWHRTGNGRGRSYNSAMAFLPTALPSEAFTDMSFVRLLERLKSAQTRPSV